MSKFIYIITLQNQAHSPHVFLFQQELEQKSQQSTEDEQSPGVLSFVPPSQPLVRFQTKTKMIILINEL